MTSIAAADRRTDGAVPRFPGGRRTVAAVIVALLLSLIAGYAVWQAVLVQLRRPPYPLDAASISQTLNETSWNTGWVTATGAGLALIGLWLLILAAIPSRSTLVQLAEQHSDVATGMRAGDLRRALNGAAMSVDGIDSARTVLGRSSATTTVTSPLGDPSGLTDKVEAVLTEQLTQLDPLHPVTIRVRLAQKDRR